jgi:hypothetical protein
MTWPFRRRSRPSGAPAPPAGRCVDCAHFRNDAAALERAFPGLGSMGSARADVRAYDGLCARHGVYLSFADGCAQHEPAGIRVQRATNG